MDIGQATERQHARAIRDVERKADELDRSVLTKTALTRLERTIKTLLERRSFRD